MIDWITLKIDNTTAHIKISIKSPGSLNRNVTIKDPKNRRITNVKQMIK